MWLPFLTRTHIGTHACGEDHTRFRGLRSNVLLTVNSPLPYTIGNEEDDGDRISGQELKRKTIIYLNSSIFEARDIPSGTMGILGTSKGKRPLHSHSFADLRKPILLGTVP